MAPGGDKLVFRETNGNFDVVSVDLATGAATTVVATERDELMPAWAAAEPTMVYGSNRNGPDAIWLRRSGVPDRPVVTAREFPADSTAFHGSRTLAARRSRHVCVRIERDAPARLWMSAVAGGTPATGDE